jgi:hypothetical protein
MQSHAASVAVTCAVVATVFVLIVEVRHPSVQEATAFLVLTAASYVLSPSLPPVLAMFFVAWIIKTMDRHLETETFTINAPYKGPRRDGPAGNDAPIYHDGSRLARADLSERVEKEALLATPELLHAAQSRDVPPARNF